MLISHKYKFIFIKTKKTGGTSLEIALSKFMGGNDVITRLPRRDARLRKKLGYTTPRNFKWPKQVLPPEPPETLQFKYDMFYNHMPAWRVRERVSPMVWRSYFKFCVERNPWDKALSWYWWVTKRDERRRADEQRRSYGDVLTRDLLPKLSDWRRYTLRDELIVDRVIRYHDLEAELEELRQELGIPEPLEMPRAKGGYRRDRTHHSKVLSPELRHIVAEVFHREIDTFGFTWEDGLART